MEKSAKNMLGRLGLAVAVLIVLSSAAISAPFIVGTPTNKVYTSNGEVTDANDGPYPSYGEAYIYRTNIDGQGGNTSYNPTYLPMNGSVPARWYKDMGTIWTTAPEVNDVVKSIVEVRKDLNGWTGRSYVGAVSYQIDAVDIAQGYMSLPKVHLQPIPTPGVKSVSPNSITISWQGIDMTNNFFETYVVVRSDDGVAGTYEEIGTVSHSVGEITFTDSAVLVGATYFYKLKLRYAWGSFTPHTTTAASEPSQPISTVTAPTVTSITPSEGINNGPIAITKLEGTNFFDGIIVKLIRNGHDDITATNVNVVSRQELTCTFDLNGAVPGPWDVYVQNTDSQSVVGEKMFMVRPDTVPDPTECTIVPLTSTSVKVIWTNNSSDVSMNHVERSGDSISYSVVGSGNVNYSEVGTTAHNVETYTGPGTTGLGVNTRYWFRVNSEANGIFSDYAVAEPKYTLADRPEPQAFSDISTTVIIANWASSTNPIGTQYRTTLTGPGGTIVTTTDQNYKFSGLAPETAYNIRVEALNHDGVSSGWVVLGDISTLAIFGIPKMYASDTRLFSGDIIATDSKFTAAIDSASGVDPSTIKIYVDGSLISDGTFGNYDTFGQSGGTATFEYTVKTLLTTGTHVIRVTAQDIAGNLYDDQRTDLKVMSESGVVGRTILYPNPYDPLSGNLLITYNLGIDTDVTIYMFDVNGRLVWKNNYLSGFNGGKAGYNEVTWNGVNAFGHNVTNDIYLVRIIESGTRRLLGKAKLLVLRGVSSTIGTENSGLNIAMSAVPELSSDITVAQIFNAPSDSSRNAPDEKRNNMSAGPAACDNPTKPFDTAKRSKHKKHEKKEGKKEDATA